MSNSANNGTPPEANGRFLSRTVALPLLLLPILTILLVSPKGEFSIIDDWVHMREVKTLLSEHRYVGAPPLVSTLVAQAVWGAAFTKVFGLGYTALRYSTIVIAFIGIWAMARSALECGASRGVAILCGVSLWCVPYYMVLSYSFMTDVPFTSVCGLSGWFYLRALRLERHRDIILGSVFSSLAFFIRQHGILMLGSMGATLVLLLMLERRRETFRLLATWVACSASYFVLIAGWAMTRPPNPNQDVWFRRLSGLFTVYKAELTFHYVLIVLAFLGVYTLPLLAIRLWQLVKREEKWPLWRAVLTAGLTVVGLFALQFMVSRLRYGPDVLHNLGSPVFYSLPCDTSTNDSPPPIESPAALRLALAIAGLLHGSIVAGDVVQFWLQLWHQRKGKALVAYALAPRARQCVFLTLWLVAFIISFAPFLPDILWRYVVQMAPAGILLSTFGLSTSFNRNRLVVANVLAGTAFALLLCFLQDSMAWHGARSQAIDKLVNQMSVRPEEIRGGWEFNFQFVMDAFNAGWGNRLHTMDIGKGNYVIDDKYSLSFGPLSGFHEIERVPYYSWFGFRERAIYILRRDS